MGYMTGVLLTAPLLLFLVAFIAYPLAYNVNLSFYTLDLTKSTQWIPAGLNNYAWAFADSMFWASLTNTVFFTAVSVTAEFLIGLGIAYLISKATRGASIFRTLFLLPWVIPTVTAVLTWRLMLLPNFGVLSKIGDLQVMWLSSGSLALPSVIIADVWKTTPFFIVLLLAGFLSVPPDHLEAIRVDGASAWQELRYVSLPFLAPLMVVVFTLRAIEAFTRVFEVVLLLTEGGPGYASEVLPTLIFRYAFRFFRLGNAATMGVITIGISLAISIPYFYSLRRRT